MSSQDLLAPPKLTVRKYAMIVAGIALMCLCGGLALAAADLLSLRQLAFKALLIVLLSTAIIGLYSRLMRIAHRTRPERMPVIHAIVSLAGFAPIYGFLALLAGGTQFTFFPQTMLSIVPAMFGTMLAAAGFARRVGETMHCPHCEYEFKFDNSGDAPPRCPECGKGWLGLLKKGRRLRSPRLIALGTGIAVGSLIIVNPIFYMGFLSPHLPTSLLFASLYVSPKDAYSVWDEMATRPLNPTSIRVLVERVLNRRGIDQYDTSAAHWFEIMAAAGKIPPDLLERFYSESFKADLAAPARVKAGEPFTVHLRVTQASGGWGVQLAFMFGGYTVGDDPTPLGRQTASLWAYDLRPQNFTSRRDVLPQTLQADRPGETHVRATYWIAFLPSFTETLNWQPDGAPAAPSSAMWFRRFEIEKIVRVE